MDQITENRKRMVRQLLENADKESLEIRVERWIKSGSYYSEETPTVIDLFFDEAFDMYVHGNFLCTILISATIVESLLLEQTRAKPGTKFKKLNKLALNSNLIKQDEFMEIDSLRILRNSISHAIQSKLAKYAQRDPRLPQSKLIGFKETDAMYQYIEGRSKNLLENDALKSLFLCLGLVRTFYITQM